MTTSTTQDQVKTEYLVRLLNPRRQLQYEVVVIKDRGNLWRVASFEDFLNRYGWMVDILEFGESSGLLSKEELVALEDSGVLPDFHRKQLRARRPEDVKMRDIYNKLMNCVRVIFFDKFGERINRPVVDGTASIIFDKGGVYVNTYDKATIFRQLRIATTG